MKVNIILDYYDKQLKKNIKAGEDLDVTEERANVLIKAKVAQVAPTPTPEVETKPAPKKKAPAKKKVEG